MPLNQDSVESKLAALNLRLDSPPKPAGNYQPFTLSSSFLYLSGMTPKYNGVLQYTGALGRERTREEGYQAARLCMVNQLNAIRSALGDLERVSGIMKMTGYIQADSDFAEHSYVLNGASDLLVEVFGDRGAHARSAVGVASLPGGASVEVELIVRYE